MLCHLLPSRSGRRRNDFGKLMFAREYTKRIIRAHGHHAGSIFVRRSPDPEQFLALKDYSKREDRILNHDTQSTPTAPSTAELITRAQRGEEKAFEALFHQHWQRVYSLCLRMIGNTAEAEELTQ